MAFWMTSSCFAISRRTRGLLPSALAATDSQWLRRAKGRVWKSGRGAYALEERGAQGVAEHLTSGERDTVS
ncbi:hypothetical protein [Halomonas sp.]|uniref:hypothetical protein n=1 Tax=Halomonas sp. TaxID=1486246 RepID=UPI00384B6855